MIWNLKPLIQPESIAIVGASERSLHAAGAFNNLKHGGFTSEVYLINPNRSELFGLPCYPSMSQVPRKVDLALVVVRYDSVLDVMRECAEAQVGAAIVISEGFAEVALIDHEGQDRQTKLREFSLTHGIPICGPNSLGIINIFSKVWAYSGSADILKDVVRPGNLAIVSQSGGNCINFIKGARARAMGLSYVISSGNEASVEASDYIDFLLDDRNTRVIGVYVEGFKNPVKFRAVAERALRVGKPLVVIKVGSSAKGRESALAHTGSLAGADRSYEGLFRQLGIVRAQDVDDLLDKCTLFAHLAPDLWPKGKRLGVITRGGGAATVACDLAAKHNLDIPDIDAEAAAELRKVTYRTIAVKNPVDLIGAYVRREPRMLPSYLDYFGHSNRHDAVVQIQAGAEWVEENLEGARQAACQYAKPFIISSVCAEPVPPKVLGVRDKTGVPIVLGIDQCLKAIEVACRYVQTRNTRGQVRQSERDRAKETIRRVSEILGTSDGSLLSDEATHATLSAYDIPLVDSYVANSSVEAIKMASCSGYPVVLKSFGCGVSHKTEYGAVKVDLRTPDEVAEAYSTVVSNVSKVMRAGQANTVVVQPMLKNGVEFFVGGSNKEEVGSLVLVGVGGTMVELLDDVSLRVAPITEADGWEMLEELRYKQLLRGFRGQAPRDTESLIRILISVSELLADYKDRILEIDLNPVFLLEKGSGAKVVDARVTLKPR